MLPAPRALIAFRMSSPVRSAMPRMNSDGGMLTDNDSVRFLLFPIASAVDTVSASVCVSSLFS